MFLGQISDYILTSAASGVKDYFQEKGKNDKDIAIDSLLDEAEKYEDGAYDTDNSAGSDDNGKKDNEKPSEKELDDQLKNDSAGGNPLKAFKNLINNGLLSLVCDVSKVSEAEIQAADIDFYSKEKEDDNSSAARFFKSLLKLSLIHI